jgi:hypothetical protein
MAAQWYAIRLKPNAQRLSKQDSRLTNIEFALSQGGIEHYMPQERREIIHHRTKKPIDKCYPLIPGYAFVAGVHDWLQLHRCDFVAGVLGVRGTPLAIPSYHIDAIMAEEAEILLGYQHAKALKRQRERERDEHIPQRRLRVMFPAGSVISIDRSHSMLAGMRGRVVDATGRHTIRAMIETLNGMVNAEISVSYIEKVA